MLKTPAKNKIVLLCIAWFVISLLVFFWFFGFLDADNQKTLDGITQQEQDLSALQAQNKNYAQGKEDLEKLAEEPLPLGDFFSKDITLVNEIKVLEDLGQKFPVKMQLSGISGVITSEPKANTKTSIVEVPYNISVNGSFPDVTNFIETLEHLNFITDINSISVTAAEKDAVTVNFSAYLYLAN